MTTPTTPTPATTNTQLVKVDEIKAVELFASEKSVDDIIERSKAITETLEADASTAKGRKLIASMAYRVAQTKTALDEKGKILVAGTKAKIKNYDSLRKRLRDGLDKLRDDTRAPVNEYEAKAKKADDAIRTLFGIAGELKAFDADAKTIQAKIDGMNKCDFAAFYIAEKLPSLEVAKEKAISDLTVLLAEVDKATADATELENLRKDKEKRDAADAVRAAEDKERLRKEEVTRKVKESADRAKAQADREARERIEETKRIAEAAVKKAEDDAKARIEKAENDAKAKVKAARDEAEKAKRDTAVAAKAEAVAQLKKEATEEVNIGNEGRLQVQATTCRKPEMVGPDGTGTDFSKHPIRSILTPTTDDGKKKAKNRAFSSMIENGITRADAINLVTLISERKINNVRLTGKD